MIKKFLFVFIILFLLIIAIITYLYFNDEKTEIFVEIREANYCSEASECINVGGKCPFGCYNYVNEKEVERISTLINKYESTCAYSCIRSEGVICENNKCVGLY